MKRRRQIQRGITPREAERMEHEHALWCARHGVPYRSLSSVAKFNGVSPMVIRMREMILDKRDNLTDRPDVSTLKTIE